jgi:hypothetical protein
VTQSEWGEGGTDLTFQAQMFRDPSTRQAMGGTETCKNHSENSTTQCIYTTNKSRRLTHPRVPADMVIAQHTVVVEPVFLVVPPTSGGGTANVSSSPTHHGRRQGVVGSDQGWVRRSVILI